jgi:D-alanine-D-alanine ligase
MRRLRITVLRGGPSAEREISLASGQAVADALRRRGHDVFVSDIGPENLAALDQPTDVVFPALHGTFGEDGVLQAILEQRGIRFVGSGSQACALAMDKVAAKQRVADLGIDTPAFEVVTKESLSGGGPQLAPPLVVKPVAEGSSVLTTIVRDTAALLPSIQAVVERYGRALLERFITGDEITVGMVGDRALPPICVRPQREFYDYQAKYQDDRTEYLFEAGHPEGLLAQAQQFSRRVFVELGCRHLARVDWMLGADGRLWFLEINTIPGFTSHSLVPKAAARLGVSFDELVEQLVCMAAEEST